MLPGWLSLAQGTGLLVLGCLLTWSGLRLWQRFRRQRRATNALRAEESGAALLVRHGYRLRERQVRRPWPVRYGEQWFEIDLRADYLVERHGQRWVAEVKSGPLVSDLRHGPTRRQLLEYLLAFGVDGVLLVDTRARSVNPVEFPDLAFTPARHRASQLWFGVLLGAALAAALLTSGMHFWRHQHWCSDQAAGKARSEAISRSSAPKRRTSRTPRRVATASNCLALGTSENLNLQATNT